MPPRPISTDAEHFAFESNAKERLDLYGSLLSWTDTIKTGVVEKQIVKRAGAIFQRVGSPPRRFEFRCSEVGPTVRARYQRIVDVVLDDPEGQLTHPRFGQIPIVIEEIGASESPAEARDTIEFTLRAAENGLRTPPKPAATALGATASATGASVATLTASGSAGVVAAGVAVSTRSAGLLVALQAAETGSGTLLDVDASLAALNLSVLALDDVVGVPPQARRAAYVALAAALQARNALIAGRPALVQYRVDAATSLSNLMQTLYGSRGKDERELCERLNRLQSARRIAAGTWLLLTDPTAKPVAD